MARAASRKTRGSRPAEAPPRPAPRARLLPRLMLVLWAVTTIALLWQTMAALERRITWHLAVDQYGYLTFAHDLARGRIFHDWPPLEALEPRLRDRRVDVLSQSYVYDRGRTYCRYAPGFPMLLAAWMGVLGRDAAHYLNPTVYLALLALILAFQTRLFRSRWRATMGVALAILFPTHMELWGTTVVRDLPTHLAGLLGLYLLLPAHGRPLAARRMAAAGLAIGFAACIRPDAIIYLVPAGLMVLERWRTGPLPWRALRDPLAAGALGVVVGLAPFLAYNWAATGNPFRPTQGMEVEHFLPAAAVPAPVRVADARPPERVGFPPRAWKGGTSAGVQGGGLRLANLPSTLPKNLAWLRTAYGDLFLAVAVWGAILTLVRRRLLFLAAVPYIVCAILLFSCWSRPNWRYLVGIYLFVPMLVVEGLIGTLDLVRRLALARRTSAAQIVALVGAGVLVLGATLAGRAQWANAIPFIGMIAFPVTAVGLVVAAVWPARRPAAVAPAVIAVALTTLLIYASVTVPQPRERFQRAQMRRAHLTFAGAVRPRAIVITTEDVGRPADNIDYYTDGRARALYLTDLQRWRIPVADAVRLFADGGWVPYLFLPPTPDTEQMLAELRPHFRVELVRDVPPAAAIDYFVKADFHNGVPMRLYRLEPLPAAGP